MLRLCGVDPDALPDVPTTEESGVPDLQVSVWHGLYVPGGTPAEIVEANLEQRFRSERSEYPYPLVIRLVKYVEIPRRLRKHVTNAILFARVDPGTTLTAADFVAFI